MTETTRFVRAAIVMFLDTLLVIALICLFFLDKLVNEILYDYGLVFSYGWAEPYWLWMRTSMALIGIVIFALSALEFLYPLLHREKRA